MGRFKRATREQREADARERRRQYDRAYYLANRERILARVRAYNRAHRERIYATQRERRRKQGRLPWTLVQKVAHQWGVSIENARLMIRTNNFPP